MYVYIYRMFHFKGRPEICIEQYISKENVSDKNDLARKET